MKALAQAIYDALAAEMTPTGTLSYVKSLELGGGKGPLPIMPALNIYVFSDDITNETMGKPGRSVHKFTILVECAVQHANPDVAYMGDTTYKGILDIMADVSAILENNLFGTLSPSFPCLMKNKMIYTLPNTNDMTFVAHLTCEGGRWMTRPEH